MNLLTSLASLQVVFVIALALDLYFSLEKNVVRQMQVLSL